MSSIKNSFHHFKNMSYFGILVLLVLLSGCGSTPEKELTSGREQTVAVPQEAQAQYDKVITTIEAKAFNSAATMLNDMIKTYPQLLGLQASLGWVYLQLADFEKAESVLTPLLTNPVLYKPDAFITLGIVYREQGKFKQALQVYEQGLVIWPESYLLNKNMGILNDLYLGDLNKALTHYQLAKDFQPQKDRQLSGWIKDLERRVKQ